MNKQPCETPTCEERAIMCLYARNPGTKLPPPQRNEDPFYPVEQADFTMNLCVECFHVTAATMREANYVGIRATAYRPKKDTNASR